MRTAILETITAALEPVDFVLALWQGGSAAHGYTDQWSDLDLEVIVEDDGVQATFDLLEQALATIAPIRFKYRVPEPIWHGHSQCYYQLEGISSFLIIDFAILKRSSPNRFLEVERHGKAVVSFDKAHLLNPSPLDRHQHGLKMQARFAQLKLTFEFLQVFVKKEINRGHVAEAIANYHAYTLQPLVELLGMIYRPHRYDFRNAKYFSRDFPPEIKAQVEPLYCVVDLADLANKQHQAEQLFAGALPQAEQAVQAWR
jgi:predicted nucleotidyltransferase